MKQKRKLTDEENSQRWIVYGIKGRFKKGHQDSEKTKKNKSKSHMGLVPWNKGKKYTKIERIDKLCQSCEKPIKVTISKIKKGLGKFCSHKCIGSWLSKNKSGENSPRWKGGNDHNYSRASWKEIRNKVYKRDNWHCQICGKHCYKDIQCHHIIAWRISKNDSLDNLITVCLKCHRKLDWQS